MISTLYNDHREEEERKKETGVTGLGKIPEQILISVVTALKSLGHIFWSKNMTWATHF